MKTLRTLVAILTIVAVAGTFTGSVVAAEATGRQPKAEAKAVTKKVGKEGSKTVTKAKAGASRMAGDAAAKKGKGDKPLKAGKNAGGRKKAA